MTLSTLQKSGARVALHAEGVDRNILELQAERDAIVALHAEGVDRNPVSF